MNVTLDQLKVMEVMTWLCMDRASRALSKTLKTGAKISFSKVFLEDLNRATEKMNEDDREMTGVLVNFKGNVECKLLFMLPIEGALILTDLFLRQPIGTSKKFDVYTESAVQELGNVMAGHVCNALVANFDATLVPTPPVVHNDYAGVMFANLVLEQGIKNDQLLLIDTKFEICKTELKCYLFLLPEIQSFKKLITAMGADA